MLPIGLGGLGRCELYAWAVEWQQNEENEIEWKDGNRKRERWKWNGKSEKSGKSGKNGKMERRVFELVLHEN